MKFRLFHLVLLSLMLVTSIGCKSGAAKRAEVSKDEIDQILHRLKRSIFVDYDQISLQQVLMPELFACNKICVAKKRTADGIYYSGLRLDQFRWFLEHFRYHASMLDYARQHETELDHLRYDVGIDYFMDAQGQLVTTKTSFYGTL